MVESCDEPEATFERCGLLHDGWISNVIPNAGEL
jgi:hypothetical protein